MPGGVNPSLPESAERFNPNGQVKTVWGHQNPDLVQAVVRTETDLWANADVKIGSGRVPDRNLACWHGRSVACGDPVVLA